MLALQRTAGNRAAAGLVERQAGRNRPPEGQKVEVDLEGADHPLAAAFHSRDTRFRVPGFDELKRIYTDKSMKIPQKVVQDRVRDLLKRMAREKRLKTKDDVDTIIKKIFPSPGVIDETAFKEAIDSSSRKSIYESVLDADSKVKPADKAKLKTAMSDAVALIKKAESDSTGLKEVFGAQAGVAKSRYAQARSALIAVSKDMDSGVSTDYNLDDPEVGLGGWADHGAKHMHLLVKVVKVVNAPESKATLIHEAAHLGHGDVDDFGYYGTAGFEAMSEADKINNAAHYEELPRRQMGISRFEKHTFTAGKKKGGGAVTWEDKVRRRASEFLRKAWDAGVDTHTWIRGVRKAGLAGDRKPFTDEETLIMEVSKLMDLTVHAQASGQQQITRLDVTVTESIARGVSLVGRLAASLPMPEVMGPFLNDKNRDDAHYYALINAALNSYGALLGSEKRNWELLDWLVAHYRSLP